MMYVDINKSLLKSIPNPNTKKYEIQIDVPELTFLGVREQPDFGKITIVFTPSKKIIELKSLKHYFFQFRNIIVSYERLIGVVFDQLTEVYQPESLKITLACNPRGGISSILTMDSTNQ